MTGSGSTEWLRGSEVGAKSDTERADGSVVAIVNKSWLV